MNIPIAFSGTYADMKLIKTRSVLAVVIEIPIEQADKFISSFGVPQPGAEKPVALALLTKQPGPGSHVGSLPDVRFPAGAAPESAGKSGIHPLVQRAGILAKSYQFRQWVIESAVVGNQHWDDPVAYIRNECGIKSRAELATNENAAAKFEQLYRRYLVEMGQRTEQR